MFMIFKYVVFHALCLTTALVTPQPLSSVHGGPVRNKQIAEQRCAPPLPPACLTVARALTLCPPRQAFAAWGPQTLRPRPPPRALACASPPDAAALRARCPHAQSRKLAGVRSESLMALLTAGRRPLRRLVEAPESCEKRLRRSGCGAEGAAPVPALSTARTAAAPLSH